MKVLFQEKVVRKEDPGYDGLASAQIAAVLALLMDGSKAPGAPQVNVTEGEVNRSARIHESGGDQQ
jgi:hypothetical protein